MKPCYPGRCGIQLSGKKNKAKLRRNSGQEYVSTHSGKVVKRREVGEACKDGCFDKLGMGNIKAIHESFWALSDFTLQNTFIQKFVYFQYFDISYNTIDAF